MFYVSVRDAGKVGLLLGPLPTKQEAESRVDEVRRFVQEHDPWAAFYAFGTCRWKGDPELAPLGKLNETLKRAGLGGNMDWIGATALDRYIRDNYLTPEETAWEA